MTGWHLSYEGFDPAQEGLREALCTLGNGYVATRGASPEARADDVHYPGTYLAGGYNRLVTRVGEHTVENEDLVNWPNWLVLDFRREGGQWFRPDRGDVREYRVDLDLRAGVLRRVVCFDDPAGHRTRVTQQRLVHMGDRHLAGLETTFVAENWSGVLEVRSALDAAVTNDGVARYRDLEHQHLQILGHSVTDEQAHLLVETVQSHLRVAEAARTRVLVEGAPVEVDRAVIDGDDGLVGAVLRLELDAGRPCTVEKVVAVHSSRDPAISEPALAAREHIDGAGTFDELARAHSLAWDHLWRRFDIEIEGSERAQLVLRVHLFHLLTTVSPNTIGLDVGVPARGWHGEAYRGHVFWDELFILPAVTTRMPALTRSLLLYRHRRLPAARRAAAAAGHAGAMFPWQSASDGREESQRLHLNPRSGRWLPDNSHLQRHIGIAVAYNVWKCYETTGDLDFLQRQGAELLLEVARFWSSVATFDEDLGRYVILGVMGPDEYHDAYPDADRPGLDNNAYTNILVVWVLQRALELDTLMSEHERRELWERLRLQPEELERWEHITRLMVVPFHDGVISQFSGYDVLEEFDWDGYRRRYGDIQRLDRILEAEGDSTNRYKLSKQADVLMLFYLLSAEELKALLDGLGYGWDPKLIPRTITYYLERTAHGSTLSNMVTSWVLARSDRTGSWTYFTRALESDISDVQGGTVAEGIHLGAMAGTVDLVQRCYGGVATRAGVLRFDSNLPDGLTRLRFELHHRGVQVMVDLGPRQLSVTARPGPGEPIVIGVGAQVVPLAPGATLHFPLPG